MLTFKLLTESIRQGLPHISTMSHEQLTNLTKGGRVNLHHVTEKTDGSTFMIGHDKDGFYTQSSGSGSERMRTPQDYHDRVTRRSRETGKEPDYTGARAFADAHEALQRNAKLTDHLRSHAEKHGGETQLRGELFSRQLARPSEDKKGEVKLVGTSYDPNSWGSKAKVVIHSRLPENQSHDTEHFKRNLSNDEINFDDDIIKHQPSHVDVSRHLSGLSSVDHELLKARTTNSNRTAKQAEQAKLSTIAKSISDDVDEHVKKMGISPKFGSGSEGAVVHPSSANPSAPRFKVTSDTFRAYKADPTNKEKFKKRTLTQIKESFIIEGGNIKVKTPEGIVSASPFKVEDRSKQRSDVTTALGAVHDAFHQEHGEHLFGKGQKGLKSGSIYGGSTKHFMDTSIGDDEFKKHKPSVGDFDVQVTHEHKDKLTSTLKPGRRFGAYTVVGMKKHGNENTAVMRHDNGQHHQFDFEATDYDRDEPTKASQFLHSADWNDTKAGVKGAHHKILLNSAGGSTHKFSITHGLRSRTDDSDVGTKEPTGISKTLFGDKAEHSKVHSFLGVSELIKRHIPQERHQEIYDKFKSGLKSVPNTDHGPALKHLRDTLGVKDSIDEAAENNDHHTSVIPMVGFSPISHMGHAADLGGSLSSLPGTKHVGISGKSDVFSADERKDILSRQWGQGNQSVHIVKGAGETIRRAYESLPQGRRHLHILVGHDRKDFAEGLKKSLEAGKIKEMGDDKFDSVTLHYPKDTDRSHGMSGTRMRQAAGRGDVDEVHRHLGSSFSKEEAGKITNRMKGAIDSGKLKLVRESEIMTGQNLDDIGELNHEKFGPMLDTFVQFASKKLGIKSLPSMKLEKEPMTTTFGGYNPADKSIVVISKNRHPMDIYRTVAHELVHHKQNEDGRLGKDIAKEGATGSDIENEANSEAGKIMRWFAKSNPKMFKSGYVTEGMTTSGGIRGLGNVTGEVSPSTVSQYVLDNQNYQHTQLQNNTTQGLYSFDDDNYWLDKDGSKKYKSKFIDKITKNTNLTNNYRKMFKSGYVTKSYIEEGLQDTGKMKAIFLAGGPGSGKDFIMKKTLEGHGLTEINSDNAFEHLMRMQGLDPMMPKEQDYERNLARGSAKRITKEKERLTLAGRRGVIINGTADDPEHISQVKKQLENLGYESKMLFVNTNDQVSKQRNFERGIKGGRKVPDGTNKKGIPDGSPDIRSEKWEGAQRAREPLRKMFGDQHFIELDNSEDYRTVDDKRKKEIDQQHNDLFKHYRQFVSTPAATSRAAGWIKKEKQKRKIRKYAPARATSVSQRPNVKYQPNASELEQAKVLGVTHIGGGQFGRSKDQPTHVSRNGQLVMLEEKGSLSLKNWFDKSKSKDGKKGWVQVGGRYDGKPCARQPGQTSSPKCRSSAERSSMSKKERSYAFKKKQREDPNQPQKSGAAKPTMVKTYKHQKESYEMKTLQEKKDACYSKVKSRYKVWPSAYASGALVKCRKVGADNWGNKSVDENFEDYIKKSSNREEGTKSVAKIYKKMTPGQKKLAQEDNTIPRGGIGSPGNPGVGPETTVYRPMMASGYGGAGTIPMYESVEEWYNNPIVRQRFTNKYGNHAIEKLAEAAERLSEIETNNRGPKFFTHLREAWSYGKDPNDRMGTIPSQGKEEMAEEEEDAGKKLSNITSWLKSGGQVDKETGKGIIKLPNVNDLPDNLKQFKVDEESEDVIKPSKSIKGYKKHIHPMSRFEKKSLDEATPAWQRKEGKNPEGGLNRTGVESYRKANPGSKLQTAVTTEPSKLKKGSKSAKRRLSFCRRMKGMKKKLTSAETARDPDSRINKSLRKWNCEE
jgi:cytidylate kinase